MAIQKKQQFDNYKVHKITSGNFLREKPVFSHDGQFLVVSNNETCHLYNTSTGEHLAELFSCDSAIVSIQLDPSDDNYFFVATNNGKIYRMDFATETEPSVICQLKIDEEVLKKLNFVYYAENKDDHKSKEELDNYFHCCVYNDTVYASWNKNGEGKAHVSIFNLSTGKMLAENNFINIGVINTAENFAMGRDFIVLLGYKFVYVEQISTQCKRKHRIDLKNVTYTKIVTQCNEVSFATGDSLGRIIIWRNIFDNVPLKDFYHWHTLPVRSLLFTECGSHMLSGGDENVLVKWSLATRAKNFLPRLSSNIYHLSISKNNSLLSVTTADSRILIINLNFNCLATVQHFSRWTTLGRFQGSILTQDPRTENLVLSGRTGHVQFISSGVDRGRFLYTFDVTQSNFITRERNIEIPNIEVKFTRFTRCGKWLITAEAGGEEARLKFWWFDPVKQEFSLNTDVDVPHGCSGIEFLEVSSNQLVASGGPDGTFKLWGIVEATHLQKTRLFWSQIGSGKHHQQIPATSDFSRDGSLLGVGFGPALTLWDTEKCQLKSTLVPPLERNQIKSIRFGNHKVSHLIISGTETELNCWNIVTLCRQWVVQINLSLLVSDPNSSYMCAFSKNQSLFVFDPSSPQAELHLENISEKNVTSALFIANRAAPYLYFLTEDQSLYCLGDEIQRQPSIAKYSETTPFSSQLAQNIRKDIVPGESLSHVNRTNNFSKTILDAPAHAMPPVSLLVDDYLLSLLQTVQLSDTNLKPAEDEEVVVVDAINGSQIKTELSEYELRKFEEMLFKR